MPASLNAANEQVYTVSLSVWTGYPASAKGFRQAMADGGFVEGRNINYLYDKSGSSKKRQRKIAQNFRAARVDMVYSLTTPGTRIIKETMDSSTPTVFSIFTCPADSGLIESFEYSGNNLVGTSNNGPCTITLSFYEALFQN